MIKSCIVRFLALPVLLCLSVSSNAALVVYTTEASFLAATTAVGVDNFTGFDINSETPSPIFRNAGAYGYTASASVSTFYGAGTPADPWLSTDRAADTVTFDGFTNGAQAIGGNFFGSDRSGQFAAGSVTLTATDSNGSSTQTIINASTTSFLGFVSSEAMISLSLSAIQVNLLWPTADNLVIAQRLEVNDVPEPGSIALVLAGLGIITLRARRRRA